MTRRRPQQLTVLPQHGLLCVAPSQSGKSAGIAIPNLLEHDGPAVVVSSKSDLVDFTAGARQARGQVWVYDPTGESGAPTARWSPLRRAQTPEDAIKAASAMVNLAGVGGGISDKTWALAAGDLLSALLHAAAVGGHGIEDVLTWLRLDDWAPAREVLAARDGTRGFREVISAVEKDPDKLGRSQSFTARTALSAYNDPGVLAASHACDWTPELLLSGANTLYLVAGSRDQQRLAPVFLAILDELREVAFRQASERNRTHKTYLPDGHRRLLWLTDEAANVAPIPDFAHFVAQAAGMGITPVTLIQDLAQLREVYGADAAASIATNHRVALMLSGVTDPQTMEWWTRTIGKERRVHTSRTRGRDTPTETDSSHEQDVLGAREGRELEPFTGVAVYGHRKPMRVRLRMWFDTPELRERVRPYEGPWQPVPRTSLRLVPNPQSAAPMPAASTRPTAVAEPAAVCGCGAERGEHAGAKHGGGCERTSCKRFSAPAARPARPDRRPAPVPSSPAGGDLARDTLTRTKARLQKDTSPPPPGTELIAWERMDEFVQAGQAEWAGLTKGCPAWHDGRFWMSAGDRGLAPVTDQNLIAACDSALAKARKCRAAEEDVA